MIEFQHVELAYSNKLVLKDINLTIRDGEFSILIGASGCGKTTLLKLINRLHAPTKGKVLIDGHDVQTMSRHGLPARIGYVVQDAGLFPHLTVAENISLALRLADKGYEDEEIDARIDEMLRMVNLDPRAYREIFPSQMSGGQRQRVGIARAFAPDPKIVLMDEPFSALDPVTRSDLQAEVKSLQQRLGKTIVFVTHDMNEAIKLADRISILEDGHISQTGTPEEILKHPANEAIEEFIGAEKFRLSPDFIRAEEMMNAPEPAIGQGDSIQQAIGRMKAYATNQAFVVDASGIYIGKVLLADLKWKLWRSAAIADYVRPVSKTAHTDETLHELLTQGIAKGPFPVPVVDANGRLRGVITQKGLFSTLSTGFTGQA